MTPEAPDDWRLSAACTPTPLLMFPTSEPETRVAKAICRGCPVVQACGEDALRMEAMPGVMSWGVRGGMAAKARRRLLNEMQERAEGVG